MKSDYEVQPGADSEATVERREEAASSSTGFGLEGDVEQALIEAAAKPANPWNQISRDNL